MGGGNDFFGKYGYSEYVGHDRLQGLYFGENISFESKFSGDICFGTLDMTYSKDDNRIDVEVDGQWNNATVTISIPPQLHTSELEVLIDNNQHDFSIKKKFKGDTVVRENSVLKVIPSKSNHPQIISIFPHEIIDPYRTSAEDKEFLNHTDLMSYYPKNQLENGILPKNIQCKLNFKLIFKSGHDSLACVKPQTAKKLVEREWGFFHTVPQDRNKDSCQLEPEPGLCKAAFPKFYFNAETSSCEQFTWGGCGGTVPFNLKSECQIQCEPIQGSEYSIRMGTFGFFYPSQNVATITSEKIIFDSIERNLNGSSIEPSIESPISKKDWLRLIDLINFPNFLLLPDSIGECLGCTDAAVVTIEISNSTITKQVSFESHDKVQEIIDLREKLQEIIQKGEFSMDGV